MIFTKRRKLCLTLGCVLLALLILALACLGVFFATGGKLQSQQAAERFRGEGEGRFSQISVFFPVSGEKTEEEIRSFRQVLEQKLMEASIEAEEDEGESALLFTDAYSAQSELTVKGSRGTATAPVTGVGGDWFFFHPLYLRCGSYIQSDDVMHDRVLLDEELAWKLFGGVELEGLSVEINGKEYLIAGVVSREDDRFSREAYTLGGGLFMHYDQLNAIKETNISCYELVCVDPVSGFALDIAGEYFTNADCVENSRRFTLEESAKNLKNFGQRTLKTDGVIHPYWESAARMAENRQALALALAIIFIILPIIGAVAAVVILLKAARRKIKDTLPGRLEEIRERRWQRRGAKEE